MALIFDETDISDIENAKASGGKIWYNNSLKRLKRKIKDYYILQDASKCCYCSKLFHGEFRMVIDIEHVLPQTHFASEMFTIQNLNVACKRCNMDVKNDDTSFICDTLTPGDYYNSVHYRFIHPNLDIYSNHLMLKTVRSGDFILNKYIIKDNRKGQFTYDYFELKDLEIDTFNQSQGIKERKNLNEFVRGVLRVNLLKMLSKI